MAVRMVLCLLPIPIQVLGVPSAGECTSPLLLSLEKDWEKGAQAAAGNSWHIITSSSLKLHKKEEERYGGGGNRQTWDCRVLSTVTASFPSYINSSSSFLYTNTALDRWKEKKYVAFYIQQIWLTAFPHKVKNL